MRRILAALAFACLVLIPTHAASRGVDLSKEFIGDRWAGNAPAAAPQRAVQRQGRKAYRKAKRVVREIAGTLAGYAQHLTGDLSGFPDPLVAKVRELQSECGSKVVSAFRPGAYVARTRVLSNHARKKAVDMAGNPACMYAHLKGFPGGVSTDYYTAPGGQHIHISYNEGGPEWGKRFAHGGKAKTRYAKRKHRVRYARAG